MPDLMAILDQQLGSGALRQLGAAIGADGPRTQRAVAAALMRSGGLMNMLDQNDGGSIADNLARLAEGGLFK